MGATKRFQPSKKKKGGGGEHDKFYSVPTNFALDGLNFWMHVFNIHVEGTVSQIF